MLLALAIAASADRLAATAAASAFATRVEALASAKAALLETLATVESAEAAAADCAEATALKEASCTCWSSFARSEMDRWADMSELLNEEIVSAGLEVVTVMVMITWRSSSTAAGEGAPVDAEPVEVASIIVGANGGSSMASGEPLPILFPLDPGKLHYRLPPKASSV